MTNRFLPHCVLMVLAAVAFARPAFALPPSSAHAIAPVRVELVDDATLDGQTGTFYGADMLVGVRIDLVSKLATAQGGSATAVGSLYVRRTDTGFDVRMDSHADASAGSGVTATATSVVTGADGLRVDGIGQVVQIAGDGNRMGNLALIQLGAAPGAPSGFNGASGATSTAGDVTAHVSFVGGGIQLGLVAPGATIGQSVTPGASSRVMQTGQIAGDGITASNALQLQMMTTALPASAMQQLGIREALSAMSGLRR